MCTLNYSLEEETRFFVKMKSYFPCFLSTFLTTFAFTSHHVALINLTNDNKYPFHPHLFPVKKVILMFLSIGNIKYYFQVIVCSN